MARKFTTRISLPKQSGSGFKWFKGKKQPFKSFSRPEASGSDRSVGQNSSTRSATKYGSWSGLQDGNGGRKRLQTKVSTKHGLLARFGNRKKLAKIAYSILAVLVIIGFFGTIGALAYMQNLTKELPDPERPFENEKFQFETSIMYDRNGKQLYRLFDKDGANRDLLKLEEDQKLDEIVPPELKWSLLAAEDIDFYEHPGFDFTAIIRCGSRYATSGTASCGGSTITQQVVKIASLEDNTQSVDRKLKELVLALQLERKVEKDDILLLYMNIAPEGGNIYGMRTASRYYFDKDLNELTFKEAVIIASIPNDPSLLSPTRSYNPEVGEQRLENRVNYTFDNLLKYKNKINKEVRKSREAKAKAEGRELTDEEKEDFITEEKIEVARKEEVKYKQVEEDINAPHFVFFAKDLLTKRGYNNGEPFTEVQMNTGGYKIYTTLDLDLHKTALDVVQNVAIKQYGTRYGNKNAAMMTMIPSTGEILTMVGSKCYGESELKGCNKLDDIEGKLFDPKVNILATQQQPGSSIKPMVYYEAFRQGILSPGSQMADIPIEIGTYKPVNSTRDYTGIRDVRYMLAQSRNIPAITALMAIQPAKLAEVKKDLGYSINVNPDQYGPSAALGSQDVYAYEHATAFATFANGGKYVPYEAIRRIEDKNGKVVFDITKDNKPQAKQVLDEKAVYLVNDTTNPNSKGGAQSPVKWRGRDMSGKTGTSEGNRDNWFVNYSPDFVTLGWAGNNDNTRMGRGAFGSTNAEPWVRAFMERVGDASYFKSKTRYNRPGGIVSGQICNTIMVNDEERKACEGSADLYIQGRIPPVYVTKQKAMVCIDQTDKLARDIDKNTGNAVEREFQYARMPVSSLQKYLDAYLKEKQGSNGIPTEQCTVNRSPNGSNPWAEINNPTTGSSHSGTITTNIKGFSVGGSVTQMEFYLGNTLLGSTASDTYSSPLTIPGGTLTGTHVFTVRVTDSNGKVGSSTVQINISGVNPNLNIVAPTNGSTKPVNVNMGIVATHSGALSNVHIYVKRNGGTVVDLGVVNNWTPTEIGTYEVWAKAVMEGYTSEPSPVITITVN